MRSSIRDRGRLGDGETIDPRRRLRVVVNVLEFAAAAAGDAPISPAGLRQAIACVEP